MIITLLGADGMLGSDLLPVLRQAGHDVRTPDLDITRHADLATAIAGADAIVNSAAWTDVDGAETQPEQAHAVNAIAVGKLGELAAKADQYVLHISTDFVYDGEKDSPYTEADAPNPINVYGASKWQGEQALAASGAEHAILRIEWTYGRQGHHFVAKLCELARSRPQLKVVDDQLGAPTPTTAVASVIQQALAARLTGTYLYAAADHTTRYEVACLAARHLDLPVEIVPCASSEFPAPARRPLNSRFDCGKLEQALDLQRRSWRDYLIHYLIHYLTEHLEHLP